MKFDTRPLAAGLHLVSTPIGSARDITLRALDVLASASVIAAEDTRTARKLMDIHGVPLSGRQVLAYHDHSGPAVRDRLVAGIGEGGSVAYVSEAGTPLVADPRYALARAVIGAGLPVFAVPGASAVLAALTVSGLPTDRFAFVGFLPNATTARQTALSELRDTKMTLVFYESPKRLAALLADMRDIVGPDRPIAVCRELTKKFEEVVRGPLGTVLDQLEGQQIKGEIVVLLGPATETEVDAQDIRSALEQAMQTARVKDAATLVAGALGLPRRQVYQVALEMSKEPD